MATIPSHFRTTGLSLHYRPCIATTATDAMDGTGDLSELVESYSHEHSANNGFDNATITLKATWKDLENWWFSGIGRDIEVFNPDLDTVWHGFVNSLSLAVGGLSAERGPLIDIANYAFVVYTIILDDSVIPIVTGGKTLTIATTDTDSISKYGQWEKVLSGGTCTPTTAEQYRDTFILETRYPISSEELNLQASNEVLLTLNCLGYWAWLKAYTYSDATAGTRTISTKLSDILAADPNGIFSTDYSYLATNGFLASRTEDDNATALSVIASQVAVGDVNDHRFTFGIWEDQIARYRDITDVAITPTRYEHYLIDDKVRVAEFGGGAEVDYWDIRADEWVFVADFLEGQAPNEVDRRDDDRFIFAEKVGFSLPDTVTINGMRITTLPQFLAKRGLGGSS